MRPLETFGKKNFQMGELILDHLRLVDIELLFLLNICIYNDILCCTRVVLQILKGKIKKD